MKVRELNNPTNINQTLESVERKRRIESPVIEKTNRLSTDIFKGFTRGAVAGLGTSALGCLIGVHVFAILVVPLTLGGGIIGAAIYGIRHANKMQKINKFHSFLEIHLPQSDEQKITQISHLSSALSDLDITGLKNEPLDSDQQRKIVFFLKKSREEFEVSLNERDKIYYDAYINFLKNNPPSGLEFLKDQLCIALLGKNREVLINYLNTSYSHGNTVRDMSKEVNAFLDRFIENIQTAGDHH